MERVNRAAYTKLIKEDIEWLNKNTNDTLERRHIIDVLKWSIGEIYNI